MAIDVEISVLGGKVVITVGAQSSAKQTNPGAIATQGTVGNPVVKKPVGGDAGIDPPPNSGGGGPGSGTGCLVIGPIVIGDCKTGTAAVTPPLTTVQKDPPPPAA